MKSYYKYLSSNLEYGEKEDLTRKPILRSSGIFPVVKNHNYSSRILFLGYWLIKRRIPEVGLLITLRDQEGKILLRKFQSINSVKAFTIELDKLLDEISYNLENFLGSIETEFNTTRDMVFPYPALVLQYFNSDFTTCVHTMERIYNDFEDLKENEQSRVPESGFDIYGNHDLQPFMTFVNGPLFNPEGLIEYIITNSNSEKFSGIIQLGKIKPYETKCVEFGDYINDLAKKLRGKPGSISIKHNFEGFFPRLLVGNIQKSFPSVSFTHSFYDCSSCNSKTDYWNRADDNFYDSSSYIPLFVEDNYYTDLILYPNFSPSDFTLQIDLYNKKGEKIYNNEKFLEVFSSESKLVKIQFKKFIEENNLNKNEISSAHLITKFKNNNIASRLKFGLNVGISGLRSKLPCNICFSPKLGNPILQNKPGSFHWSPLFIKNSSVVAIGNFSPKKNYIKNANIEINFYRKKDDSYISKNISLNPYEEYRITPDKKLKEFLEDDGWITIKSDNPNIQGFYFNFYPSGTVAADHFF
jgi:hypothetical protein